MSASSLFEIQKKLAEKGLHGVFIGNADRFGNCPAQLQENLLQELTGFGGSFGVAFIDQNSATLFTDGRYLEQANEAVVSGIAVYDFHECDLLEFALSKADTRVATIPRIGLHFGTIGFDEIGSYFIGLDKTPRFQIFDFQWEIPDSPIQNADISFLSSVLGINEIEARLTTIRDTISSLGTHQMLIGNSQDLSWLIGCRDFRRKFNLALPSFALLTKSELVVFVPQAYLQTGEQAKELLAPLGVRFCDIANINSEILTATRGSPLAYEPTELPPSLHRMIGDIGGIKTKANFLSELRKRKNVKELEGFEKANLIEAIVLSEFCTNLSSQLYESATEVDLSQYITNLRRNRPEYLGDSFETISAFDGYSAQPHYNAASSANPKRLSDANVLLIDTGAHYTWGTTDTTRTFFFGNISPEMRKHYTIVLRANISLAMARFRAASLGYQLDTFARRILWDHGLDYEHGTGHGIGHLLSVHELPYRMTKFSGGARFHSGMVVSDEPGLYLSGRYGIRIETSLAIRPIADDEGWLEFTPISCLPIPVTYADLDLLDSSEIAWLSAYNKKCSDALDEHLTENIRKWIRDNCTL